MAAFDLEASEVGEGAEPTGDDVFRYRPAGTGTDCENGTLHSAQEGQDLFLGKTGSRGESKAWVVAESQSVSTGFRAALDQKPDGFLSEVGPRSQPCFQSGLERSAGRLFGWSQAALGVERLGQSYRGLICRV